MVTKQDGKSSLIDFVVNPRLFSALHKKTECNNSAVMNENIILVLEMVSFVI